MDLGCDWAIPVRPSDADAEYLIDGMRAGQLSRRFVEDTVAAVEVYEQRCK